MQAGLGEAVGVVSRARPLTQVEDLRDERLSLQWEIVLIFSDPGNVGEPGKVSTRSTEGVPSSCPSAVEHRAQTRCGMHTIAWEVLSNEGDTPLGWDAQNALDWDAFPWAGASETAPPKWHPRGLP